MADIFRDSPAGQVLRWATNNRILRYADELPGFVLPKPVAEEEIVESTLDGTDGPVGKEAETAATPSQDVEAQIVRTTSELERAQTVQSTWSGTGTEGQGIKPATSAPIHPVVTSEGITLVDWYSTSMYKLQAPVDPDQC